MKWSTGGITKMGDHSSQYRSGSDTTETTESPHPANYDTEQDTEKAAQSVSSQDHMDEVVETSPSQSSLTSSYTTVQSKLEETQEQLRQAEAESAKLRLESEKAIRDQKELLQNNQQLLYEIQRQNRIVEATRREWCKEEKSAQSKYGRLNEAKMHLENDNERLRRVLAKMSKARQPLRNEEYYQRQFDFLNNEIEMWAVAQSKKSKPDEFTTDSKDYIISVLKDVGHSCGAESAEYLRTRMLKLYKKRPIRIALIRHILGLYIFDKVLRKYAFGFDDVRSTYLNGLEDQFLQQGSLRGNEC
jgi:predicted RNase H-like nuclease (RuvC/YqgF family)